MTVDLRDRQRRENRVRRKLNAHGYALQKSRSRTFEHADYALFWVLDRRTRTVIVGEGLNARPAWTLEDVERWVEAVLCVG